MAEGAFVGLREDFGARDVGVGVESSGSLSQSGGDEKRLRKSPFPRRSLSDCGSFSLLFMTSLVKKHSPLNAL